MNASDAQAEAPASHLSGNAGWYATEELPWQHRDLAMIEMPTILVNGMRVPIGLAFFI